MTKITIKKKGGIAKMDREKIIKGLEECAGNGNCMKCQYGKEKQALSCKKLLADALTLLKEQDAVEKNKECHEDKIAVECLNAIQTINKYIDEEEDECGCTYWKDKKGYAFKADTGYFFEGLNNFEAYLIKRLKKAVKCEWMF